MKRPTHEAARDLGLHPANLVIFLAGVGVAFEDVWPEIESSWIDTVRAQDWQRFGQIPGGSPGTGMGEHSDPSGSLSLGDEAGLIVEKLWRHSKWGNACVSLTTIQKIAHLPPDSVETGVKELLAKGVLVQHPHSDACSLDTKRKAEIEQAVEQRLSKKE